MGAEMMGPELDGGLGALAQVGAPQGALGALPAQEDPFAAADAQLSALSSQVSPLDRLRQVGASMIPDAETIAAERTERRNALRSMIDRYLQADAAPIQDPLQRMLVGMASAPRGSSVAQVMGLGAGEAMRAREADRALRQARVAAAGKAEFEGLNALGDDRRADMVAGANMMAAGTPQKPKQFSSLVNEVLERRNQIFDKLQKLGVDISTPESMAAVEARIDREVAPLVKAMWAEYPQYRDLITQSMPRMFATYPTSTVGRGDGGSGTGGPRTTTTPGAGPSTRGEQVVPSSTPSVQSPGVESPFAQYIQPPTPRRTVDGMLVKDKAAEAAQKENAKAATKYYDEVVRTGADAATTTINAAQQLRAIGPNTGKLAPLKKEIGGWFEALGIKDGFGLIDQAIKSNNAEMLLQQMANAILLQAKGVQTEGDAQRAFRQAAQLSDPKQAWEYKLRAMEAAAWRLRYRQQLYSDYSKSRNGNYDGADTAFARFEESTPFVRELPTRDGGKKAVFFNEYLRKRQADGVTLGNALAEWSKL